MKRPNIFIIAIAVAMPVMGMTIISPALSQIEANLDGDKTINIIVRGDDMLDFFLA